MGDLFEGSAYSMLTQQCLAPLMVGSELCEALRVHGLEPLLAGVRQAGSRVVRV